MKKHSYHFRPMLAALVGLHLTGCVSSLKCGDARFVRGVGFPLATPAYLSFPKVPIDRRATFVYRVTDLPQALYPEGFELEIPEAEASGDLHGQPWRETIVHASLLVEDNAPFYERTISFAKDWNGNIRDGKTRSTRRIFFFFADSIYTPRPTRLPNRTSYIFRIAVVRPSSRVRDVLDTQAFHSSSGPSR